MKVFLYNSHLFFYSVIHLIIYTTKSKPGTFPDTEDTAKAKHTEWTLHYSLRDNTTNS